MFRLCRKSEAHLLSPSCDVPSTSTSSIHLLCYSARLFTTDCRCNHNLSVPPSCSQVFKPPWPCSPLKTRMLFTGKRKTLLLIKSTSNTSPSFPLPLNPEYPNCVFQIYTWQTTLYPPLFSIAILDLIICFWRIESRFGFWLFWFGVFLCMFLKDIH